MSTAPLNVLRRERKRRVGICIDREKDTALLQWARAQLIFNQWGMENRSAAIEKMIQVFIIEGENVPTAASRRSGRRSA